MSAEIEKAIQALQEELNRIEQRSIEIKKTINNLSLMAGQTQPFENIESGMVMGVLNILPDQFFGKGFSTAVKQYLKMKGRAATASEILDALKRGGFEFPVTWKEKERLRILALNLSKNRYDFVPVPIGDENAFGLWEFYPEKKREREKEKQLKEGDSSEDKSRNNGLIAASGGTQGKAEEPKKKRGRPPKAKTELTHLQGNVGQEKAGETTVKTQE